MQLETETLSGHLLNEREAAHFLGCSASLLRKWRLSGGGPDYCHVGRLVRYPVSTLNAFVCTNTISQVEKN